MQSVNAGTVVIDSACMKGTKKSKPSIRVSKSGLKITRVNAVITRENIGAGSKTNSGSRKYVQAVGCPTDDAGHIIANMLGGKGGSTSNNIFPQHGSINRGVFKAYETYVREELCKKDKDTDEYIFEKTDVKVTLNYGDRDHPNRPTQVHYSVINHKVAGGRTNKSYSFYNDVPNDCPATGSKKRANETFKELNRDSNKLLKASKELRIDGAIAEERLINYLCEQDIEERNDKSYRKATNAAEKLETFEKQYKNLMKGFDTIIDDLEDLLSVDDSKLKSKVNKKIDALEKEQKLLTNLDDTVLEGQDNDQVRNALTHNLKSHNAMMKAGKYDCMSSGKPSSLDDVDCISIEQCTVWEFGPATEDRSDILKRGKAHISKVNSAFDDDDDDDIKKCFPDGFEAKIATYKACTPRSRAWGR